MTDGSLLTVFVLPVKELAGASPVVADLNRQHLTHSHVWSPPPNISLETAGPECIDRHGQLCSGILQVRLYKVPCPIQACVLGINRFFAYCHKKKMIQRFPLPQVFSCLLIISSVTIGDNESKAQCARFANDGWEGSIAHVLPPLSC